MSTPVFFAAFVFVATTCVVGCPKAFVLDDEDLRASVNRVERETGGRVLSAERRNQSGREMNRIKVYTPEGRVRVMWEDTERAAPPLQKTDARHDSLRARMRDSRLRSPRRDEN